MEQIALKEIAKLFLKLGFIGFGGPAAHIAMMREEVVVKRKWLTDQAFLDLVGAANLIPGPNSTELAIHIGHEKGGWKGLCIAGLCFILPAVLITGLLAILYNKYGSLPEVQAFTYGIKPAIIAVILSAIFPLAKKSATTGFLILIGLLVLTGALIGVNEIVLMFGAGGIAMIVSFFKSNNSPKQLSTVWPAILLQTLNEPLQLVTNTKLFLIFLKIGAILYGSGYVLFAFLDSELVNSGMMSRQTLVDAIAVGQFTPGPVFSAVTFIGFQINGIGGAVWSTIAIFLPSFIFVGLLNPLVKFMKKSVHFSAFLDAVNVASVAMITAVCWTMTKEAITDWRCVLIGVLNLIITFYFKKVNSAFIVIGSAILGYVLFFIG